MGISGNSDAKISRNLLLSDDENARGGGGGGEELPNTTLFKTLKSTRGWQQLQFKTLFFFLND